MSKRVCELFRGLCINRVALLGSCNRYKEDLSILFSLDKTAVKPSGCSCQRRNFKSALSKKKRECQLPDQTQEFWVKPGTGKFLEQLLTNQIVPFWVFEKTWRCVITCIAPIFFKCVENLLQHIFPCENECWQVNKMRGSREEKSDSASSGEDEESLRELVSFVKVQTLKTLVEEICELF